MTTMTVRNAVVKHPNYKGNIEQVNMQHFAELGNLGYNGFLGQQ